MEVPAWDAQRVTGCPSPRRGPGIARKPPGCSMHSPARDFPLGFYVPCCRIWAGSAAGQQGQEMITATSYPCLPAAGFISSVPIPAFSLLFSLEGRDHLLKAGACCRERFRARGDQCGCPLAAPAQSRAVLLGTAGAAHEGMGTPAQWCPGPLQSGSGRTPWGRLRCLGKTVFACICKQPCQICKLSPAEAPRAPNCFFLLHSLRHQHAWPGPALGQGMPAAANSMSAHCASPGARDAKSSDC